MLTVSGLKNFYFLPHFHDMRCGYARIMEIIRMNYHRNPYKGDVFFFMSKNERSVRMLMYEKHSFNVHTRTFAKGDRFMKIRLEDDKSVYLLPISCDDMNDSEKTSFIQFLVSESHKKDQQNHHLQQTIDAQGERLSIMQLTLDKYRKCSACCS